MPQALTTADLIFSEQANHQFSKTLNAIRRSNLSICNRLRSIQQDALFADQVADIYRKPLIANERCGSWYIDPQRKAGIAYFKSTDGHTGVWKFSTRRLNLRLLDIIGKHDGCMIVDSTRRGKRMPDALSKTIPIWCNVLNRFTFPERPEYHDLYTPPQVVSHSEHEQILALLPFFLESFQALHIDADQLKAKISKPLRPYWITPESELSYASDAFRDYHLVICCTVSRRIEGSEVREQGYIQGAGDDTENWAHGLTPCVFWANQPTLLSTSEDELPQLIKVLQAQANKADTDDTREICIKPTTALFIAAGPTIKDDAGGNEDIEISLQPRITEQRTWVTGPRRLEMGLGPHKIGSRNIRSALPYICEWLQGVLNKHGAQNNDGPLRVIISGESSKDHAVGIALGLLCLFFDDQGAMMNDAPVTSGSDKGFIRERMAWIMTSMPDANPSRATLQSVNSVLMGNRPR